MAGTRSSTSSLVHQVKYLSRGRTTGGRVRLRRTYETDSTGLLVLGAEGDGCRDLELKRHHIGTGRISYWQVVA